MACITTRPLDIFRRFHDLPKELRLQIWGYHALPSTSQLHPFIVADFVSAVLAASRIGHPWCISEAQVQQARKVMQVNCEARNAILGGREIVRCRVITESWPVLEGSPLRAGFVRCLDSNWLPGHIFVDWERDIFHVNCWMKACYFRDTFWSKVRHLAIDFNLSEVQPYSDIIPLDDNQRTLLCARQFRSFPYNKFFGRLQHVTLVLHYTDRNDGGIRLVPEVDHKVILGCAAHDNRAFHPAELVEGVEDCRCVAAVKRLVDGKNSLPRHIHGFGSWASYLVSLRQAVVKIFSPDFDHPPTIDFALSHPAFWE